VPQAFGLNTLKRFNRPMWRGGNEGGLYATPQGRFFHVGFPGCNLMISQYRTPTDHLGYPPPPRRALQVLKACEGITQQDQTKSRCEALCHGMRGTGVVISQCRERSPRGTRQHPVVFMPSTRMGHCGC
jgi:hypothetical protein